MGEKLAGKSPEKHCLEKGVSGHKRASSLIAAAAKGYRSPYWLTFKQAQDLQGKVKRGEKATWIVYAAKAENEEGEEYRFLKWYFVFNLEQTDGIPPQRKAVRAIEEVEKFIDALGANVVHGSQNAYYLPKFDRIELPWPEDFKTTADYYLDWAFVSPQPPARREIRYGRIRGRGTGSGARLGVSVFASSSPCQCKGRPRGVHQRLG
jgi:antirestriction protein ArdC